MLVSSSLEVGDLAGLRRASVFMGSRCLVRNDRLLAEANHVFEVVGLSCVGPGARATSCVVEDQGTT